MYAVYQIIQLSELSEEEYNACFSLMSVERRQAVQRLRCEADRQRTIAGEWLARRMLAARCGVAAEEIAFGRSDRGKPFAKGLSAEFNVSHSGECVLCAVSDRPIGADIEKIRPVTDRLIRRVCTVDELAYVNDAVISPEERTRRFFRVWTGKEAFVKYLGTGIADLSKADIFSDSLQKGLTQFNRGEYAVSFFSESAATLTQMQG